MNSMDRIELRKALQGLSETLDEQDWAYADTEGVLRCPDCNSNAEHLTAEGGVDDFGEVVNVSFGPLPWSGATVVTTELCSDCGVVLSDDPACDPADIADSVIRSQDLFGDGSVFGTGDFTGPAAELLKQYAA